MKNLLTDFDTSSETVNYKAKIHWICYVIPIIYILVGSVGVLFFLSSGFSAALGLVGIISIALVLLFIKGLVTLLRHRSTKIYVTDNYVSFSTGILGKTFSDLSLNKLEGMQLHQSLLGKTLNFGTLVVTTGNVTNTYLIEKPMELRKVLMDYAN